MKKIAFLLSLLAGILALAMIDRQRSTQPAWMVTATVTDLSKDDARVYQQLLTDYLYAPMNDGRAYIMASEDHHGQK